MNFKLHLFSILVSFCLCSPKDRVKNKVPDLSSEEHFYGDYDFLGKEDAKVYKELSPEESKEKLGLLYDKIDKDKDGFATKQELKDWIELTQNGDAMKDVEKQMKTTDLDKSGTIDWTEFKNARYDFINEQEMEYLKDALTRDEKRFYRADEDGNKALTIDEFAAFLYPEHNAHMTDLIVEETLDDIDKDKDGFISLEEYIGDLNPESEREKGEEPEWVTSEKAEFKESRDKNKDGKMDKEEVSVWIAPPDYNRFVSQAEHLLSRADEDGDGKLTKAEMLKKYELFLDGKDLGEAVGHDEL